MFSYDCANTSLTNINAEIPPQPTMRLKQRRSLDYGTSAFSLAGPNKSKSKEFNRHYSIPSSPSHTSSTGPTAPKAMILIRRQSSDKCLQKRHSVDSNNSNNSDPGYSTINMKTLLSPSQQRSPRESNSPKSCHSSAASVIGRNSSCSSMAFLSRQSSINSSKLPRQRQSDENLEHNKWFSSSSVILTRVKSMKEKFRRVVVQSVQPDDWPPPSILFSDRYRCPNILPGINSNTKTPPTSQKTNPHLVKSKSIDPSSFPIVTTNGKKILRNVGPAGSGRNFKRERLQRSMTTYTGSVDHGSSTESGIVCSDMDLKAIISTFKRDYGNSATNDDVNNPAQTGSKTPIGTSSAMGPGFGKRKLMRKQVSFDDEQGVMMINRKVSAIAEEIECHTLFDNNNSERRPSLMNMCFDQSNSSITPEVTEVQELYQLKDEEENCAPNDNCQLPLLPKEIEFDEHGQTWEIYGADPDPEILGQAIQLHLERLMVSRQVSIVPNGNAARLDNKHVNLASADISARVFKPLRVDLQSPENNLRFFARRLCGKWSCFSSGQRQSSGNKVMTSIDSTS